MANKKSKSGRDEERIESERDAEREGFGDTSGPEVSGAPPPTVGREAAVGEPGQSEREAEREAFGDTSGPEVSGTPAPPAGRDAAAGAPGEAVPEEEAASAKPEDQSRIVAEQMKPLDSDEVGTPLAGPGTAKRAKEERADETGTGDMPPQAGAEGLQDASTTDTAPADPPPTGGEATTRPADPWATPGATVAAAADGRPEAAGPADDGKAPSDTAEPEPAPGRAMGSGSAGDGGRNGGRDDGHRGAAERPDGEADDEGGRSLASTLLIALLLLIAGAAIGIWGAPRLAPHLPTGLAPVAEWLSPRDPQLENRVAALEAETEAAVTDVRAEVDRLAAEVAELEDAAVAEARVAELEARIEDQIGDQIAAMRDELAALDGTETRERLSRLEAAVEGQQEVLASLREQFAQVEVGETAAQIDAYEAELAGLRGEIRDVAGQVGALSRRIDEVAAEAQRRVETARARVEEVEAEAVASLTRAEIESDLAQIRSALAAGAPYQEPVERLATRTDITLPDGLAAPAAEGVPTLASLRQGFPDAAMSAIRADVQARADDDFLGRLRGFAEAQVATRSLEPRPGDDADAILSRMDAALRQDDLETALDEAEALPPAAADAMAGWLEAARSRQAAIQGYEQVQADLSAMN